MHVVPFSPPPKIDPGLMAQAKDANSAFSRAVLRWLLDGAAFWLLDGDGETPTAVTEKTKSTRADYDEIAAWLTDQTEGGNAGDLLRRLRKDGLDSSEKLNTVVISKRAKTLGWELSKGTHGKRWLNPPSKQLLL